MIIGGVILLVMLAVGFWFYHKGKKTTTLSPVTSDNPAVANDPTNNPYGVDATVIKKLSDDLYTDMSTVFSFRNNDIYKQWIGLSDTDCQRLYNQFNLDHQKDSGATLYGWLDGEYGIGEFASYQTELLSRMKRLNLK